MRQQEEEYAAIVRDSGAKTAVWKNAWGKTCSLLEVKYVSYVVPVCCEYPRLC